MTRDNNVGARYKRPLIINIDFNGCYRDLMKCFSDCFIIIFLNRNMSVDGNVPVDKFINGVNLGGLSQLYLSRTLNQTLSGLKTFSSNISVGKS